MTTRNGKTISRLLSYRLTRLSNSLSRSAAIRYRRDFDVSLGEWRVIALLRHPATTLNRLARRAALDKAQMSRVVAKLEARGFIRRDAGTRRSTQLSLTAEGQEVYHGLIGAANERDRMLGEQVSPAKMRVFEEVLDTLDDFARQLEAQEAEDRNPLPSTVDYINSAAVHCPRQ